MSRTLRGEKKQERRLGLSRKRLQSLKQKYAQAFRVDEWYIELPVRNSVRNKMTRS